MTRCERNELNLSRARIQARRPAGVRNTSVYSRDGSGTGRFEGALACNRACSRDGLMRATPCRDVTAALMSLLTPRRRVEARETPPGAWGTGAQSVHLMDLSLSPLRGLEPCLYDRKVTSQHHRQRRIVTIKSRSLST